MRQLEYKDNSMCGKKSNMRQSADDEKRKQALENSIFYYEYLNNTLNYILSGSNDLDHYLNYDQQALKHIISTEPRDESVYFIERTKMMKTRCDPNLFLKDLQEYGEFTNYESSRITMNQIRNIEKELQDQREINLLIKRLKKRYKIDGDLSVFEARRMDKQFKEDLLNSLCAQLRGIKTEKSGYFENNRLYRQMFNITQSSLKEENPDQTRAAKLARSKLIRKTIKPVKQEYSPYVPKSKQSLKQEINTANRKINEPIIDKQVIQPSPIQPIIKANNIPAAQIPNIIYAPIVDKTSLQPIVKEQLFLPFQNYNVFQKSANIEPQKKQNPVIPEKTIENQQPKAPVAFIQQYNQPYFDGNSQTQAHEKKSTKQKKISKTGQDKKKKSINYRQYSDDQPKDKKDKIEKKRTYNKRANSKHQMHPFSQMHNYPYRPPVIHMDQPIPGYPPVHPPAKQSAEIGIQVDPNEDIQPLKVLTPRRPFTFSIITNPTNATNPTNPTNPNNSSNSNPSISNNIVNNSASLPQKTTQSQQNSIRNSSMVAEDQAAPIQTNPQMNVENLQQINPILTDSQRFFNQSRDFSNSRPRADSIISQGRNNSQANGSKKDDIDIFFSFLDK